MSRTEILEAAKKAIDGSRHGKVEDNFALIAKLWRDYLNGNDVLEPVKIADYDVAAMMGLLKFARIRTGDANIDNWIDGTGYSACGGALQSKALEGQND